MQIRILNGDEVRKALPMTAAIEQVRLAYRQFSAGKATMPLRTRLNTDKGVTLLMPAFLHQSRDLAVKVVSVYGDNPNLGLPTVSATVLVLDPDTGMPRAFMDGDSLTALRTGAAGGVAADLLARTDARTVALFGAGVQGRAQLEAVLTVRNIARVMVYDPVGAAAEKFAEEVQRWPDAPGIHIADTPRAAVRDADIILTASTSKTPLFDDADLKPGVHITGVGSFTPEMQEIPAATVHRARVVVDSREACRAEAGDIIQSGAEIHAEVGEILNGDSPGRTEADQITFFKSVGLAVQDAVTASAVLAAAEQADSGIRIDL